MTLSAPPSPRLSRPSRLSHADREASRWLADHESGLLDADGETHLKLWLKDAENAAAYARAQTLWRDMGRAAVQPATPAVEQILPRRRRASAAPHASSPRRRAWAPLAASGLAAALAIGFITLDGPTRLRADAITRPGEQKTITLDDGSTVQMNTNSAIEVAYAPDRRTVRLLRGEAAFTVAPNPQRPFTVEAGGGSTTALGTRFIVRRRASDTQVSVTEHSVRVASGPDSASSATVVTAENQTSTYRPHQAPSKPTASPLGVSAWQDGWLVFEDQPLSLVVSEISRYSAQPINVLGRKTRNRRVSGAFRIDRPSETVARLEQTLDLRATRLIGGAIIVHD